MTQLELFNENEKFAYWVLGRYLPNSLNDDDLKQVCLMGLWKSCLTYDESKGYRFTSWAYRCITNEIFMYLRQVKKLNKIKPITTIEYDGEELDILDFVEDKSVEFMTESLYLTAIQSRLTERQKYITKCMVQGARQKEIAKSLKVSQPVICREIKKIKRIIKRQFRE